MSIIGEVIKSSSTKVIIQLYDPLRIPKFGEIVKILSGDYTIFSLIYDQEMQPIEAQIPKPLRLTRNELKMHYPDLSEKIVPICFGINIGYAYENEFRQIIPPEAPLVHDLVYRATNDEIINFHFHNLEWRIDYLRRLLSDPDLKFIVIDLIRALIRFVFNYIPDQDKENFLVALLNVYQSISTPSVTPQIIIEIVKEARS